MYNDRDDKYEGNEDSEYHFSDDEVSYEVETESTKPAAPITVQKEGFFSGLTRSKRMLISLGVFFVLVFIVYKMVAPSSSTVPQTDITAPVVAQQSTATQTVPRNAPVVAQPPATIPVQQPTMAASTQQVTSQPVMATPPVEAPASMVATAPAAPNQQAVAPASTAAMTMAQPANSGMPTAATAPQQMNQPPVTAPAGAQTAQAAPVASIPTVIPVQSPAAYSANPNQPIGIVPPTTPTAQPMAAVDANMAKMSMQSDQLVNQLRAEYAQKVNDYATQNKALQDQVQTLNTRVATMETELGQLVQALMRQSGSSAANGGGVSANAPAAQSAQPQAAVETKSPYNVQAIIPGRAWLRSDNGETITVAEGDTIRELGRVTKIDPYDGVVEINTGSKVMSLSYGNGG